MKEFHLEDFPKRRIRVLLRNQDAIIGNFIKSSGSIKKASDFLRTSPNTVKSWQRGLYFIPLYAFEKILKRQNLGLHDLEKHVIAYKGLTVSNPIIRPFLPVKESPELFELISHIFADGSVNNIGMPVYVNSKMDLINHFRVLLEKTFGRVEGKVYNRRGVYFFHFTGTVPLLLKHFYRNLQFGSKRAVLPRELFLLPDYYAYGVIRAFVDDEGCVRDNRIVISLKNKKLVFQLGFLLQKILGDGSISITTSKNRMWIVTVRAYYLVAFDKKFKLIHPQKRNEIAYALEKRKKRFPGKHENNWKTKLNVLRLIGDGAHEVKHISKRLFIQRDNITVHVNELALLGLVKSKARFRNAGSWFITRYGKKFLDEYDLKSSRKRVKIPVWQKIYDLKSSDVVILLPGISRKRLFWFIGRILGTGNDSSKFFGVHRNTFCNWKNGKQSIPVKVLDNMLLLIGENGVDLSNEIKVSVEKIRSRNGRLLYWR